MLLDFSFAGVGKTGVNGPNVSDVKVYGRLE
jgi:hypothetical protein